MTKTSLAWAVGLSLGLGFLTVVILASVSPTTWDAMQPATCLTDGCFCEAVSETQSIRQPSNTMSSLAFAGVGIWVLAQAIWATRRTTFGRPYQIVFGLSAVMIGVGSAFYHASMTFVGQFFDIFGMYLLTSLMWVYALQRVGGCATGLAGLGYVLVNLGLTAIQLTIPETRRFVFALVLVLALMSEALVWRRVRPARLYPWFWGGLLTFGLAYFVWTLDESGVWCDPTSWIQGHALWHILGAAAVYALWRWYMSEPAPQQPDEH